MTPSPLAPPPSPPTWHTLFRILLKAALLFTLCNLLFAAARPLSWIGRFSLYNSLLPGRQRLPYGENAADSYNLSLNNVPAMLHSHSLTQPQAEDEFRVVLLGDSATWGWFLENEDTLAGQINAAGYQTADHHPITAYNLGYPIMSLSKDVLLLQEALAHDPDLIIWLVTLQSFPREQQLFPPLVQNNPQLIRPIITTYQLRLNSDDPRFVVPNFWQNSLIGQRRALADLLRLQLLGFSWAATGIDQAIPPEIPLRQSDFEEDISWQNFSEPTPLTADSLSFDVLTAGIEMAGDVPVLLVNEPMFISNGRHSDLRYNSFYPRWAYDAYRELLAETAQTNNWHYLDLWDTIPSAEFTDSPVHLTPAGNALLAETIMNAIEE
ncbi:MAG: SGNH/GDSL hydrolase family protein [Ardenticatenaceae bacterium]|nr:SGNH/GDSL hydrolase family protein [Ardenticatenaceae bacterium]